MQGPQHSQPEQTKTGRPSSTPTHWIPFTAHFPSCVFLFFFPLSSPSPSPPPSTLPPTHFFHFFPRPFSPNLGAGGAVLLDPVAKEEEGKGSPVDCIALVCGKGGLARVDLVKSRHILTRVRWVGESQDSNVRHRAIRKGGGGCSRHVTVSTLPSSATFAAQEHHYHQQQHHRHRHRHRLIPMRPLPFASQQTGACRFTNRKSRAWRCATTPAYSSRIISNDSSDANRVPSQKRKQHNEWSVVRIVVP